MNYASNARLTSRRPRAFPTIQIAPFVDVVLVLLIIFMLTAPVLVSGVDVSLPEGSHEVEEVEKLEPVAITYTKENKIYVGNQYTSVSDLISTVNYKTGSDKNRMIFIRGDRIVPYGAILNILNTLNKNGYAKAILVTEQ